MTTNIEDKQIGFYKTVGADFYAMDKSEISVFKFLRAMILTPRFTAAFYFRCSSFLYKKGKIGKFFSRIFWMLNYYLNGCEIAQKAIIGAGLNLPHPHGIVLGATKIGNNATILQNVTSVREILT
jgi:serine acetyltransferase